MTTGSGADDDNSDADDSRVLYISMATVVFKVLGADDRHALHSPIKTCPLSVVVL